MCRIAGSINNNSSIQQLQQKVTLMCRTLQHGGPDDEGYFCNAENGICFGHRRLSIIDLSEKGHQPMADVHQQVWITFNGEIYNYVELKNELLVAGSVFCSGTDTEVIIQAYLHWGIKAFDRLRGMFAFGLYDSRQQLTYLVRDANGIKPLYYYTGNSQLSFASEVKALKQAGIATADDTGWKVRFLTYGHIPEPFTTLKDVLSLPKGSYLCWNHQTNKYHIQSYTGEAAKSLITSADEAKQLIKDTLNKAVQRQLIADAPIGVFLSGGIDSSLLALLANQQRHQKLQYISIYFNEKKYNERPYQQLITQHLSGEQYAHPVTYKDFEIFLPEISRQMDMPTTDGINTWFISKHARQNGLKAVLSGLGADELFGGYPSFRRIKYINYLKHLPVSLLSKTLGLIKDGYKRIQFLHERNGIASYLFLRGMFTPAEVAGLLDTTVHEVEQILYTPGLHLPEHVYGKDLASWLEINMYMQNQLLRDTDVMGMSHGLEIRVPFLDEDFTSLVSRISPELKFQSGPVKKLLIDSFGNLLPAGIYNRPKMGFTFPLQQWMKKHPGINDTGAYKGEAAKALIKKFMANQVHWSKAFALYQLQQHA